MVTSGPADTDKKLHVLHTCSSAATLIIPLYVNAGLRKCFRAAGQPQVVGPLAAFILTFSYVFLQDEKNRHLLRFFLF